MSPVDVSDFLLTPEKAPAIIRSGGRGSTPTEWEKLIGPTISQLPGQDILVQVFPKEGLPQTDEDKDLAKRQAAARAASIANRYWNFVHDEHVETSVRLRPEGNYGVYATHYGPMTDEHRARLSNRRKPRPPKADAAQASTSAPVAPVVALPTADPAVRPTAAERAKAAAAAKK